MFTSQINLLIIEIKINYSLPFKKSHTKKLPIKTLCVLVWCLINIQTLLGQKDPRASQIRPPPPSSATQTPKTQYNQPSHGGQKFQSPGFTDVGSTPHFSVSHTAATPVTTSKKKAKEQKKNKAKIRKEDIGYPTNFE